MAIVICCRRQGLNRWKARIKRSRMLRSALETIGRPLIQPNRGGAKVFTHHAQGQGYEFEAAEVARCLRAGLLESPVMPLDETLAILDLTDRLREAWGLEFPGEGA